MKFSQTTFVLHVTLIIKNKSQREQALYFGERSEPRKDVAAPLACRTGVYFSRQPPIGELARRLRAVPKKQFFWVPSATEMPLAIVLQITF